MKKTRILSVMFMAAVCFSPPIVGAQDAPVARERANRDQKERDKVPGELSKEERSRRLEMQKEHLARMKPVKKILGTEVRNRSGEKLGKIEDLVVDVQRGTIAYAVIEGGGFLGMGDKLVAVPATQFAASPDQKYFILDVTKEKLLGAPSFERTTWPDTSSKAWQDVVAKYHGQDAWDEGRKQDRPAERIPAQNRLGLMRASKIDGNEVKSLAGEKLGKVWDLMADLQSGHILFVVLENVPGQSATVNVPPTAFQSGPEKNTLYLNATKDTVQSTPAWRAGQEGTYTPVYVTEVYQFYKADRAWENAAVDNTRRNVRDASGESLTPLDQGTSEKDREITRAIRKWLVVEPGPDRFSTLAHNIKIITRDGKVTLRGVVQTEDEKKRIADYAKTVAGVTDVDNQLEVKRQ